MHIPDGYIGLETSLPALGAMVPAWYAALRKIKKTLSMRQIPLLSLCAAFSFVIMMFNIPLGPSSVHAVGAVFIAVMLGPWEAMIAVSIAIILQAFLFGDGGILAIGANCLNMAFAMPFSGYLVYRLVSGRSGLISRRGLAAVFAGSYVGINVSAFLTAVEFGIQPLLFKSASGTPLYGFYPLSVSIPAIMGEHLLAAGFIEGIITTTAIAFIAKMSPHLLNRQAVKPDYEHDKRPFLKKYKAFIIGIAVLILLTPLGLLAGGTAWGEWGTSQIKGMIGYIPSGLQKLSELWKSVFPGYSVPGLGNGRLGVSLGYVVSAVIGVCVIVLLLFASSRLISRKD